MGKLIRKVTFTKPTKTHRCVFLSDKDRQIDRDNCEKLRTGNKNREVDTSEKQEGVGNQKQRIDALSNNKSNTKVQMEGKTQGTRREKRKERREKRETNAKE